MNTLFLALAALGSVVSVDDPKPKAVDLVNLVEGRTVILSLLPEGTSVKKGDAIGELDSSAFRDGLADQEIVVGRAEAELRDATINRETAEVALNGAALPLSQEVDRARNRVRLAESASTAADARLAAIIKAKMTHKQTAAEMAKLKADLNLKDARLALKTLEEVTVPQHLRASQVLFDQAKSDEKSKAETLALHRAKQVKFKLQIERCKLVAPASGRLVYFNPPEAQTLIEEGATVRERQTLVRITPN